jgi:PAS domain S-box-containing protein
MSPISIYIVEDELLISANLKSQLEQFGYEICGSATRGESCIQEITELSKQGREPEIVLMDIHLRGDIDGIETAKMINDRFNCAIIFLTGQSSKEVYERSFKIKPFGYLLKPIDMEQTKMTIEIASYQRNIEIENNLYQKDLEALLEKRSRENKELITIYQTLIDNSLMGVAIFQEDRIVFANQRAAEIFGYSKEEFLNISGQEFSRFYHKGCMHQESDPLLPDHSEVDLYQVAKKRKITDKRGRSRWVMILDNQIQYLGKPAMNRSFFDITAYQDALDELDRCKEKQVQRVEEEG